MNSRLRVLLLIIGLITLIGVAYLVTPKILSLYFQIKGGQLINNALKVVEDIPDLNVTCKALPESRRGVQARVNESIILLTRSLEFNGANAQANLLLGRAYCLNGDPAAAEHYYRVYIDLRTNNPLGHIGLGFTREALGDPASAVQAWKTAGLTADYFVEAGNEAVQEERFEDSLRWFERATWMDPDLAQAWLQLGLAYDQMGQSEQALAAFQTAWDLDSAISTSALANNLTEREDYQGAEDVLDQALMTHPESPNRLDWFRTLGMVTRSLEKWDKAASVYERAIEEFPEQPDLYIELGLVYYERGDDLDTALSQIEKAIDLNRQSGDGYFALARLLTQANRYDEADEYYQAAIQLAPQNRWYMVSWGDNARLSGDLSTAISIYRDTIQKFPEFANAYYQVALAYRLNGETDQAVAAIEKAMQLMNPPVVQIYVRAGEIYRWAGLGEKAITAYRQALILDPNNPTAKRGLALLDSE
jgi:tetratricopeptide (TPR) repeat protein